MLLTLKTQNLFQITTFSLIIIQERSSFFYFFIPLWSKALFGKWSRVNDMKKKFIPTLDTSHHWVLYVCPYKFWCGIHVNDIHRICLCIWVAVVNGSMISFDLHILVLQTIHLLSLNSSRRLKENTQKQEVMSAVYEYNSLFLWVCPYDLI